MSQVQNDLRAQVETAIAAACAHIAPAWPLDQMIAVNPYWGRSHQPFSKAAKLLELTAASPLSMRNDYYAQLWQDGVIQESHLQQAMDELSSEHSMTHLVSFVGGKNYKPLALPLLSDCYDKTRDLSHEPGWHETVTFQVSQFCAAYFDEYQAAWHPHKDSPLYASWLNEIRHDRSVRVLMHSDDLIARADAMHSDPIEQLTQVLQSLNIPPEQWDLWLETVLMRVSGWAAACSYRAWQANLRGETDTSLMELLAIRASWEWLVDSGGREDDSVWVRWRALWDKIGDYDSLSRSKLLVWQRAHEMAYQEQLAQVLMQKPLNASDTPEVQAYFCIDVRSEVFRRHFEAQSDGIRTGGFAGFFGLPIDYTPLGTQSTRAQLPGLLAPSLNVTDSSGDASKDVELATIRRVKLQEKASLWPFSNVPASSFSLVETLGMGYLGKLLKASFFKADNNGIDNLGLSEDDSCSLRPTLSVDAEVLPARVDLAAGVLTGMGLTSGFAPLVLLVGHGSTSQNNPQRAGLDCGACCGQTGEVNARALAQLLNHKEIRRGLVERGIIIPKTTYFMAALHNTTTEDVTLYEANAVPASWQSQLAQVELHLARASDAARLERAPTLGLELVEASLDKRRSAFVRRAYDWSQTRPEWGLTNNAAFVIAPRERTRGLCLAGRSFLHDYHPEQDADGAVLTQIMTAPMIVTNWINLQYFGSTVDNQRFGSGNKTLHNVVGGRLGVFEGNGGDLRIGLAWQSIHDGQQYRHEPLRLSVYIDAPMERIAAIVAEHEILQQLVGNDWLYIFQLPEPGETPRRYKH
ncbi:YbcC family protein [Pseudidiomarina andamanensis]|uniref:Probable inorganic carbon transporter subunit DabA n=1 Tax=Pseudidiomarina andamanensis TaxID=1940690 RepID=A0AA92IMD7_9GAMM|nr:DUF2309 domain-containing protein [Pseudidiomarina andamanensis]MDS0219310.1 DUF2309 domain-containing protein [Pseudidiomarina andamanensis]QGT96044.1 DUF2309 domain-containing protein [Pseudidiomarina andamanensis]